MSTKFSFNLGFLKKREVIAIAKKFGGGGSGDVVGPTSVINNAIAIFNGITGKLLKDSETLISTDATLAANSDKKLPTEKAVKTYIDTSNTNDKGYFVDEAALLVAHPVGQDGWHAILGTTDTVWIWDGDTTSWVDSGASGTVSSVFSRTGAVTAQSGDYTASQITNTPAGNIVATEMQAAINELDSDKEAVTSKDETGGYAGLTLLKINFKNALNTFTSFFTNENTASRTYTFQDRDGTIADDTDLAAKAPLASPTFTGSVTVSNSGNIRAGGSVSDEFAMQVKRTTAGTWEDMIIFTSDEIPSVGLWAPVGTTFTANGLAITGSSINSTPIGATTPASGSFTSVTIGANDALDDGDLGVTVQAYDANTAKLDVAQVFTKAQGTTPVALTSASNAVAVDASLSNKFTHVLTENTTVSSPSNLVDGKSYTFIFKQHASSAKTLAFNATFKFIDDANSTIPADVDSLLVVSADYTTVGGLICATAIITV